ncbi:hypothetical protein [Nostoc sp. 106C]|nr:hypothetical protein [Nostoc sp. 106C]
MVKVKAPTSVEHPENSFAIGGVNQTEQVQQKKAIALILHFKGDRLKNR